MNISKAIFLNVIFQLFLGCSSGPNNCKQNTVNCFTAADIFINANDINECYYEGGIDPSILLSFKINSTSKTNVDKLFNETDNRDLHSGLYGFTLTKSSDKHLTEMKKRISQGDLILINSTKCKGLILYKLISKPKGEEYIVAVNT